MLVLPFQMQPRTQDFGNSWEISNDAVVGSAVFQLK